MTEQEKYKKFYEENRIAILQYESLRKNFHKLVDDSLGEGYWNMGMDVYECDRICCEDIKRRLDRSLGEHLCDFLSSVFKRGKR